MESTIQTYYANNAKKLRGMVDKILYKLGFRSLVDADDFYSLANEVFVDVMKRYNDEEDFDGFLYSCLTNKIKTEMTRRNRLKRQADQQAISLDSPIGEDGASIGDFLADKDTVEAKIFNENEEVFSKSMTDYLNRLSATERKVLQLQANGYKAEEIKARLNLTNAEFLNCNAAIHAQRNTSVLHVNNANKNKNFLCSDNTEGIKMNKPRKQTYTMEMYLGKMNDKDIRADADVQRLAGAWKKYQINELIVTVLTEDYIPPIILGEEINSQLWIIDGLQRSSSLMAYRYENYKVRGAIENSIIPYRAKKRDKDGNIVLDDGGNIVWEDVVYDIKNKSYNDLPDELKKKFNEYQIETVIHGNCDSKRISQLIKRYNNHSAMNAAQKAFTYIDNYAREIRSITESKFFKDCSKYTETEKVNGTRERVVLESIMCMFHLDEWKKDAKSIATYLNRNGNGEELSVFAENAHRLSMVIGDNTKDIFNSKDSFIWMALFNKFTKLGLADSKFAEFLRAFKDGLKDKAVDGEVFDEVDKKPGNGTKDKAVIIEKLHILETLMYEFLGVNEADIFVNDTLTFVQEVVDKDLTQEDIVDYKEDLEALSLDVNNETELMDKSNEPSLLAIIAYGYKEDVAVDKWFMDFFKNNSTYFRNQRENYQYMLSSLCAFTQKSAVA